MPNETTRVAVDYSSDFKRHVRALSKKYHHIRSDVQPTIEAIQRGEFLGDRITGNWLRCLQSARNEPRYSEGKEFRLSTYL